jgi:ATP-dependent helicase IRC3
MEVYDTFIVNNTSRNNKILDVVNFILEQNPNKAKILILTKSLEHGRILQNLIKTDCDFLEGATNLIDRYDTISKFKDSKRSKVLIGTKILQTGVNIEEITHLINARGLKSEIATLQALGRALRKHHSKSKVYVYDFMDQEKYLKTHSKNRKTHYKNEGHEVKLI